MSVASGISVHLMMGCIYLWGNISNYVVSYFHFLGDENASLKNAVLIVPLSLTLFVGTTPIGAFLQKRYNPKLVILVGVIIMITSIYLASIQKTWIGFVLFYCLGFPFGIGCVYFVPIVCGWEWFPENKGLISGLTLAGFGFGASIFGYITTAIANPDNLKTAIPQDGLGTFEKLFP